MSLAASCGPERTAALGHDAGPPAARPTALRPADGGGPAAALAADGGPVADGGGAAAVDGGPAGQDGGLAGGDGGAMVVQAEGSDDADGGVPQYVEVPGDPALFPLHGLATSLETRIMATPRDIGDRIGYLRMGSRMRVGPPVRGGGCGGSWHELPTGGFVCTSDGLQVSEQPLSRPSAPPPPCLTCPLPYTYGFTRYAQTPMLSKLPDLDETRVIDEMIAAREQAPAPDALAAPIARPPAATEPSATPAAAADGGPAPLATPPAVAVAPVAAEPGTAAELDATRAPPSSTEARRAPSVVKWLERGFFVSVNRLIGAKNRRLYFKTIYGRYVPESRVFRFQGFSPWHGVFVDEAANRLPVFFVKATRAMLVAPAGSARAEPTRLDRLTRLDVVGAEGRSWRLADGSLIEKSFVARIAPSPAPPNLAPGEKWIEVDLSEQTLIAYEGDRPVLATMVSTGKEDFVTPPGDFRIRSKHVATTMDGNTATDGPYSIEDVPWTMYFHRSYALHGAFWHRQYGIARSHGCVNLSPADARFLFSWTEPALPAGWHGVHAGRDRPGTRVIVHE